MGAQSWVYGIILYFAIIFIGLAVLTPVMDDSVTLDLGDSPLGQLQTNFSNQVTVPEDTSAWNLGSYLNILFSFFVWDDEGNFDLGFSGVGQIIVKLVFVWLPLTFFGLAIYYSLPTVSS